ncbi:MAG: hypothetical protein QW186_08745 [Candidatus Bathyarchaeia archaeon]
MKYIITIVTGDGEAIINIVGNIHPPQFSPECWTWSDYQKVLRKWLEQYMEELGQVADSEENITFIVYKMKSEVT